VWLPAPHRLGDHDEASSSIRCSQSWAFPVGLDRLRQLVFQSVSSEGLEKYVQLDIEIVGAIEHGPSGKAIRVKNTFGPPPATSTTKAPDVVSRANHLA
jgi:hypothetical protein